MNLAFMAYPHHSSNQKQQQVSMAAYDSTTMENRSSPSGDHHKPRSNTRQTIVVCGPSGVGKGTLISRLLDRHPNHFITTVSHTTREPRLGDIDANAYHFVSRDEFNQLIEQDAFVEYTFFSGNYYGTSWQTIRDQQATNKILVLDIEMEGVLNIRKSQILDIRCAFIAPPSLEALEQRLRSRGTETGESLRARLEGAVGDGVFGSERG
jgi:guanylate kinase